MNKKANMMNAETLLFWNVTRLNWQDTLLLPVKTRWAFIEAYVMSTITFTNSLSSVFYNRGV